MRDIHAEIEIEAPAERVWEVLTDLAAYPQWNPFLPQATGELRVGSRLGVRIQLPGSRSVTFRPMVTQVQPNRELRWRGRLGILGLFDGEHRFLIEPLGPARTRFVQGETFTGLLVPLLLRWLGTSTRQGFEEMNHALKARAERG